MTNRELLIWIHQRLIKVHGENPNVDYMHSLRMVIHDTPKDIHLGSAMVGSLEVLQEIEAAEKARAAQGGMQ